jgi:predicted dehydrogenase
MAEEYAIPLATSDFEELISSGIDTVYVAVPNFLHYSYCEKALNAHKHVIVEKPMANTTEECDAMLAAAERSGKKLAIGHVQRFSRPNRVVKEMIESGELGKLCMYSEQRSINYFLPNRPAWFTSKKMAGGGIIMNYGAHAFDKLFYVTGKRPTEVFANTANLINDKDVEGHAQIFAKFEDGLSAVITFSGYSDVVYESYYYFTGGAIRVNGVDSTFIRREGEKEWTPIDAKRDYKEFNVQLAEFVKYVNGEDSEIADGIYSKDIIAAIEKAYG